MFEALSALPGAELSIRSLVINLCAAGFLAIILKWHFIRYGSVLGNRRDFARNIPLIMLTTTMIIGIVHASVALSLGLVGAVSIVRFRTPVKEPEELGYLFLTIAVGFGIGADQVILTSLGTLLILAAVSLTKFNWNREEPRVMFLSVSNDKQHDKAVDLDQLTAAISPFAKRKNLRRIDVNGASFEAIYSVEMVSLGGAAQLLSTLKTKFPEIHVTLIDQNQMPAF